MEGDIWRCGDSRQRHRGKDASWISSLVTRGESEGRGSGLREPESLIEFQAELVRGPL